MRISSSALAALQEVLQLFRVLLALLMHMLGAGPLPVFRGNVGAYGSGGWGGGDGPGQGQGPGTGKRTTNGKKAI